MDIRKALKHAFSTEQEDLTSEEKKLLARIACKANKSSLRVAFVIFLESVRPVGYITAQTIVGLKPFIEIFAGEAKIEEVISVLSKRKGVDHLIELLTQ